MKFLALVFATLIAVPTMACMGPAEFYSVVVPTSLSMFKAEHHKFVVGDVLVLKEGMSIVKGKDTAEKLGTVTEEGYSAGTYYVLSTEGSFTIRQKVGAKTMTAEFNVVEPARYRGGCGDYRSPASEKGATK